MREERGQLLVWCDTKSQVQSLILISDGICGGLTQWGGAGAVNDMLRRMWVTWCW
jgi:hypothetical protein